ncbi:hypothetical protein [Endozoicomonas euniceicola]|uniref:Uncharacterized protein n=1 Tax=Endozoicomonas euniceicola TaxID=1234143 RepID=A0ABY6GS75_9GAMM|nr:hypothetical protein [Endozoicomonas euniceicola]UYM15608.1 hypothetical protein NX720_22670 [Endozoicomonas euniceicola]
MAQTIQSGGISPGAQGLSPDVSPSPAKNVHAPSINRHVRPTNGKRIKRPAPPPSDSAQSKTLSQRQTDKLPEDQVKTMLPRPEPNTLPNAQSTSREQQFTSKLDELNNRLGKIHHESIEVQEKDTASEHKSQIQTLKAQVKSARSAVSDLHDLIKEMKNTQPPPSRDTLMRAKGKALTARKTLSMTEFKLKNAKAKLAFFNYKNKQTSELNNKHTKLKRNVAKLNASLDESATSSKAHKVIVNFLEKQVSIAKSTLSNADKLATAESKALKNKVDMGVEFRSNVRNIQTNIKDNKLPQLKRELENARKNLDAARHQENNRKQDKIKQKKEQKKQQAADKKAIKQQKAEHKKAEQQSDTTRHPTPPQQQKQEAIAGTQTKPQQNTANGSHYKKIVKSMPNRMENFLKDMEGMPATYQPLKLSMKVAQTPDDFKQALADIYQSARTNTIDNKTAVRLRTELCQMVANKMTNPDFVTQIDNTFVRHMMYGRHQETMLDNYAASVEQLANRLHRG